MTGGAKPRIAVTRRLPAAVEARMAMLFDVEFNASDTQMSADEILGAVEGKDVLVSSITDRIDAGLIARLSPSVRLVAQFGNGVDNIDVEAAYAAGLMVTNTPSVLTEDTADMAVMLMLALPRRLVEGTEVLLRDGQWPGWSPNWMLGRRLRNKSLGIVGMGRIGTAVATRAKAFGLNIHYYSRNRRPPALEQRLDARYWDSLDADDRGGGHRIAAHPLYPRHLPDPRRRPHRPVKQAAFVVNVSRPELIDENALLGRHRERAAFRGGARRVRERGRH